MHDEGVALIDDADCRYHSVRLRGPRPEERFEIGRLISQQRLHDHLFGVLLLARLAHLGIAGVEYHLSILVQYAVDNVRFDEVAAVREHRVCRCHCERRDCHRAAADGELRVARKRFGIEPKAAHVFQRPACTNFQQHAHGYQVDRAIQRFTQACRPVVAVVVVVRPVLGFQIFVVEDKRHVHEDRCGRDAAV